jgi:hypothetical protein
MKEVLQRQAESLGVATKVSRVTTTYIYKPTDKEGQEAIMEGDYPHNLSIFLHCVAQQKDVMHTGSSWVRDPKGPYVIFDLRESFNEKNQ